MNENLNLNMENRRVKSSFILSIVGIIFFLVNVFLFLILSVLYIDTIYWNSMQYDSTRLAMTFFMGVALTTYSLIITGGSLTTGLISLRQIRIYEKNIGKVHRRMKMSKVFDYLSVIGSSVTCTLFIVFSIITIVVLG